MESITYHLDVFDGPLDLLLYLIKSNKMNIYDIPIVDITSQYLAYIDSMQKMDMDFAGEFIIMAAELLLIKSKMLLPNETVDNPDAVDPRTELVEKLLEYQKYKELSGFLKEREDIGRFSYVKPRQRIKGIMIDNDDLEVSVEDLILAMQDIAGRIERKNPPKKSSFAGIVAREEVKIPDRIVILKDFIRKNRGSADFKKLFIETCKTRAQIVATFMAVLELLKLNIIVAKRQKNSIILCPFENFDERKEQDE